MTDPTTDPTTTPTLPRERLDLLQTLDQHRGFLRRTLDGMTRDQIVERSTVSALTLGAIVKHVSAVERMWADFIGRGAAAFAGATPEAYQAEWTVGADDTPESLLATYAATAAATDAIVREHPDLDVDHALPDSAVVPARSALVGPAGHRAHHRRDVPARRPCRHHPGGHRRCEDDGLGLGHGVSGPGRSPCRGRARGSS